MLTILVKQVEIDTFLSKDKRCSYSHFVHGVQMFFPVLVLSQETVIDILGNGFDNSLEWSMWNWIISVILFSYSFMIWFPRDGKDRNITNFYYSVINEIWTESVTKNQN